jgi:hypothetical protein
MQISWTLAGEEFIGSTLPPTREKSLLRIKRDRVADPYSLATLKVSLAEEFGRGRNGKLKKVYEIADGAFL